VKVYAYNYSTTAYVAFTGDANDFPDDTSDYNLRKNFPGPFANFGSNLDGTGQVKIKIAHVNAGVATHTLNIDEMFLREADVSSSSSSGSTSSSSSSSPGP